MVTPQWVSHSYIPADFPVWQPRVAPHPSHSLLATRAPREHSKMTTAHEGKYLLRAAIFKSISNTHFFIAKLFLCLWHRDFWKLSERGAWNPQYMYFFALKSPLQDRTGEIRVKTQIVAHTLQKVGICFHLFGPSHFLKSCINLACNFMKVSGILKYLSTQAVLVTDVQRYIF